jgi:S1-C subfamily serine protease
MAPRFLLAIFALLGSLGTSATAATGPDRGQDGAVVVRVHGPVDDGLGAGAIVGISGSTVRVLTAKHVATMPGRIGVYFADGREAPAHIVKLVPNRDLALVDADVDPAYATTLHAAPVGRPRPHSLVHVWGSGYDGAPLEPGAVNTLATQLPDGPANGRFEIACRLCHEGDSGAGVFTSDGTLVGIFIGYFEMDDGHLPIAEIPLDERTIAATLPTARVAAANPAGTLLASTGVR